MSGMRIRDAQHAISAAIENVDFPDRSLSIIFRPNLKGGKTMKHLTRRAAVLVAGLALSIAWAQETQPEPDYSVPYAHKSSGSVVVLPPPYLYSPDNGTSNGTLHFPGREYRSGDGWWILTCGDSKQCKLQSARLDVAAHPHPQYDGPDVPGQMLRLTPVPPAGAILVFKPFRAPANALVLAEGQVETWRIARATKTPGTMEGELALADGRILRFVPTLLVPKTPPPERGESDPLALELLLDGQRQTLGVFGFGMEGLATLKPADYVRWIGDLDHDGKPDFVVNFNFASDGSQNFTLFLSSLAKPGEIVGLAGHFSYFSINNTGC
jgi:hypothetical protein